MPKPASQAAAGYQEPDFAAVVAKPMSALQEHFHEWVLEKTGLTFSTKKEEAAFAEGIRIGTALRGVHQASPENQQRLAEAKAAREAAAAEVAQEPKPAKAAAPAKAAPAKATKATPAKKAAAPPAEVPPASKRAPAKKAPGRKATPAVVTTDEDEAPF